MTDPDQPLQQPVHPVKSHLGRELGAIICKTYPALDPSSWHASVIARGLERPKDPSLGDYSFPCFRLCRDTKRPAPEISQSLQATWQKTSSQKTPSAKTLPTWIVSLSACKGFLNIVVCPHSLATYVLSRLLSAHTASSPSDPSRQALHALLPEKNAPQERTSHTSTTPTPTIMIEYSQPNTHKIFHIGHTRNVCLGASLCSLYAFTGYKVIALNYIGDEGTHIAKCLWSITEQPFPVSDSHEHPNDFYNACYVEATKALDEADEAQKRVYQSRISQILSDLEHQREPLYSVWQMTRLQSLVDFYNIYEWLEVPFDHEYFESELTADAQNIVDEYIQKRVFSHSQGAVGLDLKTSRLGFVMVRKSDGNTLYLTKDLALAYRKQRDFPEAQRSLYVVGNEQEFHFQQLFGCLRAMDFPLAHALQHISYGMVVLPEGKMSSRKGNTIGFWDLISMIEDALKTHLEKYQDQWSSDEMEDTLKKLTIGTLKFGMLSQDPHKQLTFDVALWTQFEGHTGPYLMYAYARAHTLLQKATAIYPTPQAPSWSQLASTLQAPEEKALLLQLCDLVESVFKATHSHKPSVLCTALYETTRAFSRFYTHCPILTLQDAPQKYARLALTHAYALSLKHGLALLGIQPPKRM